MVAQFHTFVFIFGVVFKSVENRGLILFHQTNLILSSNGSNCSRMCLCEDESLQDGVAFFMASPVLSIGVAIGNSIVLCSVTAFDGRAAHRLLSHFTALNKQNQLSESGKGIYVQVQ
jgi:hypothetical protein